MKRYRPLAWLLLAACLAAAPAEAQTTPSAPAAAAVTPLDAQHVLGILNDEKRRAELVTTLETIAKAATPAPAAVALVPNSLGAQVISTVSARVEDAGRELVTSLEAVNDLPLLWRWLGAAATDPAARARFADAAWKLAVVLACALLAEQAVRLVLRRLRATLAHWSPYTPDSDATDPDRPEPGGSSAHHGFSRAMGALRRLPYLLGRLLLDLLPIAVVFVVADLLLGTKLGEPAQSRAVLLEAVHAYLAARLILALTSFLVSPASPRLRLLHVSDWAAAFLTRWTRRIVVLGVLGHAVTEIGLIFGMYQTAHDALLKLFALVVHLCAIVAVLQAREPVAARLRAARRRGLWAAMLSRFADIWHLIAIFYIVALWLVWAIELRDGYARLLHFAVSTTAVMMAGRLVGIVLLGGLDRLRASLAEDAARAGLSGRAGIYYPVVRVTVTAVLWALVGFALLQVWGFDPFDWFASGGLGGRILSAVLLIGLTALIAAGIWEAANGAIDRHLGDLSDTAQLARAGRLRTLLPLLRTTLLMTIVTVVALMALSELGVNIAPLLAGAGVLGIAVGFGSQKLVQDLITGLFLLLENAMQVGDVVTLAGLTGTVEALSIRTIRLRALDGAVHLIPFSSVTTVTNQTRDYSYALIDVAVGLNEEPDPIADVLRAIGKSMQDDPQWASIVLDELDLMGVEKLTDLAWIMRVRLKTQAASRWAVSREFNRRLKIRFDELAIESPFTSHRVLGREPPPPPAVTAEPEEKAA